jgi:molybdopterin molybdotransferase
VRLENVARLVEEIGNVDGGERIRACDDDHGAGLDAGERLARLEGGEGTFESPEVEVGLAHDALDIVRRPPNYHIVNDDKRGGSDSVRRASLMPLDQALTALRAETRPVAAQQVRPHEATGRVLAASMQASSPLPARAFALRDGWAVAAGDVVGASSYSPIVVAAPPPWIETGQPMPVGTDGVLPPDSLSAQGGVIEIIASVAPGEGVRNAGADAAAGAVLREAGERLRPIDAVLALAAGMEHVSVRQPRVQILMLPGELLLDTTGELLERLVAAAGARVERIRLPSRDAGTIAAALQAHDADFLAVLGGTGFGREDHAGEALAASGSLIAHGIALRPGETAGCGLVGATPVILVPGRLEAALAATLTLVLPCLDHLMAATPRMPTVSGPLTRKVSSAVGMTEIVLLRRNGPGLEPLAVGDLTLSAMAGAEAWLAVPPDAEGFAAGATVAAFLL